MVGVFYNPVKVLFGWGSMNRLRVRIRYYTLTTCILY